MHQRQLRVLFLCTGNACRSQMAEGWARHLGGRWLEARSAGLEAHGKNPRAIAVMQEVGVDISRQESKVLTPAMLEWADLVVTVCGHADESCPTLPPRVQKRHWSLEDPARATGSEQEIMTRFRAVRDEIKQRVAALLDELEKTPHAGSAPEVSRPHPPCRFTSVSYNGHRTVTCGGDSTRARKHSICCIPMQPMLLSTGGHAIMKLKQTLTGLGTAALAAGILTVTTAIRAAEDHIIKIDGSSTVYPITEAVAEEFQKAKAGAVKVTVGISGTGGGFKKFCRGETDITNASRPISKKEMDACKEAGIKYIELPVAFDALTVVVHPKNDWVKALTVAELKKMWEPDAQAKVTRWNQVNPAWPDAKLALYGPGADSGTFDYFTDAINGKEKASRGDYTASEDDNVLVQGVSRDKHALGYFGYAYYVENRDKLRAVPIVNPKTGKPVAPSLESVMDGSYQPLSRPIFIYVSDKAMERAAVKEFVEFYLAHAPKLVKEVGYVPLSDKHYQLALKNFRNKKLGTGFGGHPQVGVRIEELLAREAKL